MSASVARQTEDKAQSANSNLAVWTSETDASWGTTKVPRGNIFNNTIFMSPYFLIDLKYGAWVCMTTGKPRFRPYSIFADQLEIEVPQFT